VEIPNPLTKADAKVQELAGQELTGLADKVVHPAVRRVGPPAVHRAVLPAGATAKINSPS